MSDDKSEKTPLLHSEQNDGNNSRHSQYPSIGLIESESYPHDPSSMQPFGCDDNIQEAVNNPPNPGQTIQCRVCECDISVEGKTTSHVIRCDQCNEVTPIREAPLGKKYVRCPCNCLLVCKVSSNRIACPRPNCRRVITLVTATAPVEAATAIRAPAGTCRVQCCYCLDVFMFNSLLNKPAHCPHCKKVSSVGSRYARSRMVFNGTGTLIFFVLLAITITLTLNSSGRSSIPYIFWLIFIALTIFFLIRFIYFARLKVSQILGAV